MRNGRFALWQGGMEPNIPVGSPRGVESSMKRAVAGAEREQREGRDDHLNSVQTADHIPTDKITEHLRGQNHWTLTAVSSSLDNYIAL